MILKKSLVIASSVVAALVSGCVSPSQMLVGPQGDVRRCSAAGFGFIGAPLAEHSFNVCVDDIQSLGYVPVERAGSVGIQLSAADSKSTIVSVVMPNSPASAAGILVGDRLVKINGQPVLDRAAAKTLMFGKLGESVTITMERNNTDIEFNVKRGAVQLTANPALAQNPALNAKN